MLLIEMYDTEYPNHGFTHIRSSVRGLVFKGDRCAMVHIVCRDSFGDRNHFEIPGGGIECGETEHSALKREIGEELGIQISIRHKIGFVIDRWNLLKRINVHHFYVCDFVSQHESNLTLAEQEFISGVEWHSIKEWLVILEQPTLSINAMIHHREAYVMRELLKQMK